MSEHFQKFYNSFSSNKTHKTAEILQILSSLSAPRGHPPSARKTGSLHPFKSYSNSPPPPRPSNSLRGRKYVCRRVSRCEMVTDIRDSTFAEESETGKRNYCCCGVNPRDTASVALWLLCWRRWWRWWQRRQKKIHSRRQEWEKRKAVERK